MLRRTSTCRLRGGLVVIHTKRLIEAGSIETRKMRSSSCTIMISAALLLSLHRSAWSQAPTPPRYEPVRSGQATKSSAARGGRVPRRLLGVLGGALVGGVAGYLITRSACDRCDDAAPMLFGAAIGALGGAAAGALVTRERRMAGARSLRWLPVRPRPGSLRDPTP
jgi:hypothetical protein